jgi:hypothetical protein
MDANAIDLTLPAILDRTKDKAKAPGTYNL